MKRGLSFLILIFVMTPVIGTAAPLFVIELGEHAQVRHMQKIMYEVVNTVTTEEVRNALVALGSRKKISVLGLEKKQQLGVAVVYCTDALRNVERLGTAVAKHLRKIKFSAGVAEITAQGDFFGKEHDYLVAKISDKAGTLHALHKEIVAEMEPDFVDDTFPFVPHISLGKLQVNAIVDLVARVVGVATDNAEINKMMGRIRSRLSEAVQTMPMHTKLENLIPIKAVDLYGFDRESVKKITLR